MTTPRTERRLQRELVRCTADPTWAMLRLLHPPILRILAQGRPATVEELASATSRPPTQIAEMLDRIDPIERDTEGSVLGLGLTLLPTPHRVQLPDRDGVIHAWCAPDALILPTVIGERAYLSSPCQATGEPITVELDAQRVTRLDPPSAVVSFVLSPNLEDLRGTGCDHQNLFASAGVAAPWLADHPEAEVVPVARAFDLLAQARATCFDIPTERSHG